ncbi:MAG: iron response transcriptional regulator IrrA [Magnetospiraceae bacterium]
MERRYTQVLETLRSAGLRPTRQRMALTKLLFEGEERHVTAEILHKDAVKNGIRVSLATVYNTLHQFTDAGLLREVVVDASRSYFDTTTHDHFHYFYPKSGKLVDIAASEMDLAALPLAPVGTRVERVDVVIRLAEDD